MRAEQFFPTLDRLQYLSLDAVIQILADKQSGDLE